jgi:hypothetical protein
MERRLHRVRRHRRRFGDGLRLGTAADGGGTEEGEAGSEASGSNEVAS